MLIIEACEERDLSAWGERGCAFGAQLNAGPWFGIV